MWWDRARTLVLADVHLGKAAAFRLGGMPVPESLTGRDLDRLSGIIESTGAARVLILGDLVHGRAWRAEPTRSLILRRFERLASRSRLELVLGNHDRHAHVLLNELPVHLHTGALDEPPFLFAHEPIECDHPGQVCGHIHPVASIDAGPGGRVRAKCFWVSSGRIVLPSFGSFTGGFAVRPAEDDRLFLIGPAGELVELAAGAC